MTQTAFAPDLGARSLREQTTSGQANLGLAKATFLALTSVTAATGLLCLPAVGSTDFATSSPGFHASPHALWPTDVWALGAVAANEVSPAPNVAVAQQQEPVGLVRSDQEEIIWVKQRSGLTWEQLGKVFGVSRRAVHLWANGGRMNEANAQVLRDFAAAVAAVDAGSPEKTRAALLTRGQRAYSVVDSFRRAAVPRAEETTGSPFGPEEKVENLRQIDAAES